jgi:hypothetical protein
LASPFVDEVIHHAAFTAHDQVEVTQTDVEADADGRVAAPSEAGTDSGAGGGLSHTILAGCIHENLGQGVSPLRKKDFQSLKNISWNSLQADSLCREKMWFPQGNANFK